MTENPNSPPSDEQVRLDEEAEQNLAEHAAVDGVIEEAAGWLVPNVPPRVVTAVTPVIRRALNRPVGVLVLVLVGATIWFHWDAIPEILRDAAAKLERPSTQVDHVHESSGFRIVSAALVVELASWEPTPADLRTDAELGVVQRKFDLKVQRNHESGDCLSFAFLVEPGTRTPSITCPRWDTRVIPGDDQHGYRTFDVHIDLGKVGRDPFELTLICRTFSDSKQMGAGEAFAHMQVATDSLKMTVFPARGGDLAEPVILKRNASGTWEPATPSGVEHRSDGSISWETTDVDVDDLFRLQWSSE